MTNVIQKLIEWQAGDPKRRGWSIHQYDEIVRIQMRSEPFRCDQEVTTQMVQQAKHDVLEAEVERAIVKLADATGDDTVVRHGVSCQKVSHATTERGYLHSDDDDSPYDVDGVMYCGRCHEAL